jgi:hypothetical protein
VTMTRPLIVLSLLAAFASSARADFVANATLSGAFEVPANLSRGIGLATLIYQSAGDDILYSVNFTGLSAPASSARIQIGAAGTNGPVVLPFTNPGAPASTSGTFTGTLAVADIVNSGTTGLTTVSQIAAQIAAGNAYVNISTANFPGGEIRGQLSVVPEPSSVALMAAWLAGVVGVSWRRRVRPRPASA